MYFTDIETTIAVVGAALALVLIAIFWLLHSESKEARAPFVDNTPTLAMGEAMHEDEDWDELVTAEYAGMLADREAKIGPPAKRSSHSKPSNALTRITRNSGDRLRDVPPARAIRKEAMRLIDAGQPLASVAETLNVSQDEVQLMQAVHRRKLDSAG